ncbi:hypothetical protein E5C26_20250 [Serratia proteamaculans]|uniref:hypothetical protein n=1 Tax=Serratia proteamaculans TaxID=28151 RepID=UPI001076562E|nr:hypothetical protein [Serratia proteamaculans]TFZ48674.1 hypothetical protein E5C26_20250 [Serratia proteamaculans]
MTIIFNRLTPTLFETKASNAEGTTTKIKKISKYIKFVGNVLRSISSGFPKKSGVKASSPFAKGNSSIEKKYMEKELSRADIMKKSERDPKYFKMTYEQTMASVFASRKDEVLESLLSKGKDVISYRKEIGNLAKDFGLDVKEDKNGVLIPAGEGTSALANLIKNSAYKKFGVKPDKLHSDAMDVIENALDRLCLKQKVPVRTLKEFNAQLRMIATKYQ